MDPYFDWRRQRWIKEIDEALTAYAVLRDELNMDGRGLERRVVVDEMLDRRTQLSSELSVRESQA